MTKFHTNLVTIFFLFSIFVLPLLVQGDTCTCDSEKTETGNNHKALKFKVGAIASILISGGIGVCIPMLSKIIPACEPGRNLFFMIKAFAAGVILATGFIHVLPDAYEHLTSACLNQKPWGQFPFTGFIAMVTAMMTLAVDAVATSYYNRQHFIEAEPVKLSNEESNDQHASHAHVHTHVTHGHSHGADEESGTELIRHRVISQVLELGIVVHSVIIGISLGVSDSVSTTKTLLIALSFHQFFEGMGLGGCISQAKFTGRAVMMMVLFFALTTPVGIGVGIGISNGYTKNSPTALIVEGVLNSASAGILIYMALVDLLAADFMSAKIQGSPTLLLQVTGCLVVGAGLMSSLAMWA